LIDDLRQFFMVALQIRNQRRIRGGSRYGDGFATMALDSHDFLLIFAGRERQ
jgi:hypothetical protein